MSRAWMMFALLGLGACEGGGDDDTGPVEDTDTEESDATVDTDVLGDTDLPVDTDEGDTDESDTLRDTDLPVDTDESDTPVDTDSPPPAPSHAADIQPIWTANCAPCHTTLSRGGLNLTDGYNATVNVASSVAGLPYITPGDPAASYLWRKLEGTQVAAGGAGGRMPQGGVLGQADLDLIEAWILGGAQP